MTTIDVSGAPGPPAPPEHECVVCGGPNAPERAAAGIDVCGKACRNLRGRVEHAEKVGDVEALDRALRLTGEARVKALLRRLAG